MTTENDRRSRRASWADYVPSFSDLQLKMRQAYDGMLSSVKYPFQALSRLLSGAQDDRDSLAKLRETHYQSIEQGHENPHTNYFDLSKLCTEDTKDWVNAIIKEEMEALGNPPVDFVVIASGSLARKEAGPVTDLEFAILLKEESLLGRKYLTELTQNISDRLYLLGEHPDVGAKGMRLDEADNAPPHAKFINRNETHEARKARLKDAIENRDWDGIPFEGSRPFLATVSQFANFSRDVFPYENLSYRKREQLKARLLKKAEMDLKKQGIQPGTKAFEDEMQALEYYAEEATRPYSTREKGIAKSAGKELGRNLDYLCGNKALFRQFMRQRERVLSFKTDGITNRQRIALKAMETDIQKYHQKQDSLMLEGKLGDKIDLKRQLYRFCEQFVTNVGFFEGCKSQNTQDIVLELKRKGKLDERLADELLELQNFAMRLRLKQQTRLKRQGHATYLDKDAFEKDKADLEQKIEGLKSQLEFAEQMNNDHEVASIHRELFKLEHKLEHLLDMEPGSILNEQETLLLKERYAPMLARVFEGAKQWTIEKSRALKQAHANELAKDRSVPQRKQGQALSVNAHKRMVPSVNQSPAVLAPAFANLKRAQAGKPRYRCQIRLRPGRTVQARAIRCS